jgi:hypothetical protein
MDFLNRQRRGPEIPPNGSPSRGKPSVQSNRKLGVQSDEHKSVRKIFTREKLYSLFGTFGGKRSKKKMIGANLFLVCSEITCLVMRGLESLSFFRGEYCSVGPLPYPIHCFLPI